MSDAIRQQATLGAGVASRMGTIVAEIRQLVSECIESQGSTAAGAHLVQVSERCDDLGSLLDQLRAFGGRQLLLFGRYRRTNGSAGLPERAVRNRVVCPS